MLVVIVAGLDKLDLVALALVAIVCGIQIRRVLYYISFVGLPIVGSKCSAIMSAGKSSRIT